VPINLVVAVSFGLLVPPRILGLARYGGINVHPSLLPDLRGAAPIEHAILKRRERTGVSIQTLHPTHFDQGSVLAQTSAPGMQIPRDMTATALQDQLATAGAQMLVDVLKSQKYVPPHQDAGWYAASKGPIEHAPKITKQDRFVDFSERTMDEILAIQQALGNPWCILPNGDRLIMHKVADAQKMDTLGHGAGIWMQEKAEYPTFRAACGRFGMILESTYAGTKAGQGNAKLLRVLPVRGGYYEVAGR
jgi:methionyl-tRNA formyltransferase